MATLYTKQSSNNLKTILLMSVFLSFFVLLGFVASERFQNPGLLYGAIIFSVVMNVSSYWFSDKIALSLAGAKKADPVSDKELIRMVENLSITAGLPTPAVYVIEDVSPNAFATGRNKNHAAVAFTRGIIERLERNELEGVVAHELSHIGNKDILLQSVVAVLVGSIALLADWMLRMSLYKGDSDNKHPLIHIFGIVLLIFSPLIATLIQLAISRKREFLADATGALMTRYPEGLASALRKISDHTTPLSKANRATAHLFFSSPFGGDQNNDGVPDRLQKTSFITKLFMTHPPVEERVDALLK